MKTSMSIGIRAAVLSLALGVLAGCATTTPFGKGVLERADRSITPAQVTSTPGALQGREVLWGGQIISSRNLNNGTELTVLAYPLDSRGRPDTDQAAQGRFIALQAGYLETADYAPNRQITVYGQVSGVRQAQVGEANYPYPVVQVQQIHLWPTASTYRYPPVHFGVGVGIGL